MRLHHLLIILFWVFLLGACQRADRSVGFVKVEEFTFPLESGGISSVPSWQITDLEAGRRYAYFHIYEKALKVFDWASQELLHDISFTQEGPNGIKSTIGYYLDDDFVVVVGGNELIKINYRGEVLQRISNEFITEQIGKPVKMVVNSNFRFETFSYDQDGHRLFMVVTPEEGFFDATPGMVVVDWLTLNIQFVSLPTPERHSDWRVLSQDYLIRDYYYPYLTVTGQELVYNFAGSPVLYRWSLSDMSQPPAEIKYAPNKANPLHFETFNQEGDPVRKIEHFVKGNYHFGPIKYDAERQVYYQIYIHPAQLDAATGEVVESASIMAIDAVTGQVLVDQDLTDVEDVGFLRGWCIDQGTILIKDIPDSEDQVPYIRYKLEVGQ